MLLYRRVLPALAAVLLAPPSLARVVSYAPVTDKVSVPAVQQRTNRSYVLIEGEGSAPFGGIGAPCASCGYYPWVIKGRLVVHDSKGERDPRVALPVSGEAISILSAAAWEGADGTLRILAQTALAQDPSSAPAYGYRYSPDGGASWKALALPTGSYPGWSLATSFAADRGGPLARGAGAQMRPATAEDPFVVAVSTDERRQAVYAVSADGSVRSLFTSDGTASLVGSDREGRTFLVLSYGVSSAGGAAGGELWQVGLDGQKKKLLSPLPTVYQPSAFLTPGGDVYLTGDGAAAAVYLVRGGALTRVAEAASATLFAVPTADFTGAWVLQAKTGTPTVLSLSKPGQALAEQWRDITGPEVEALHAGASGRRLLVQVHRPRPQVDQRLFKDPALAIWEVGGPAPRDFDELFLNEYGTKGFVHLDVDSVGSGAAFVFDSGLEALYGVAGGPSSGGAAGGADVVQEWGVVKASLRQRLVIPAVARVQGRNGSFWRTDVALANPAAASQRVGLRFVPGGQSPASVETSVDLAPGEVRTIPDVLGSLFALDAASGSLYLEPEGTGSIDATSRTYTGSPLGTYGMGVPASDVFAAASSRFPYYFSAALPSGDVRTNFVTADVGGRGSTARLELFSSLVFVRSPDLTLETPTGGRLQVDDLSGAFGMPAGLSASVAYRPQTGETVAGLIAIDNVTNDPTYFPPDLPAPVVRTVPAIVHTDGAAGARFRSDAYLLNTTGEVRSVSLAAKLWDQADERVITFTLLPRESKVIPDILSTLFGKSGVARLRYVSNASGSSTASDGVRLTTRTYTVAPSGGTYGLLVPPLNSFQSAGSGESLVILLPGGAAPGAFRTNLALVDLSAFATGDKVRVRVELLDDRSVARDAFDVNVAVAGGLQLDDVFRARGFDEGSGSVIRISPYGGLVAAYATRIDNGTNDPTYFGAALAAR